MDLSLDDYIVKKNKPVGFQKKNPRLGTKVSPGRVNVLVTQKNALATQRKNQQVNRNAQLHGSGYTAGYGANRMFDARQKLSQKEKPVPLDARQKLKQKVKFSNAVTNVTFKSPGAQGHVLTQIVQTKAALQRPGSVQGRTGAPQRPGSVQGRTGAPQRPGSVQGRTGAIQVRRPVSAPGALPNSTVKLGNQDMRIKILNAKSKRMDARDKIRARQQAKTAIKQVTAPSAQPATGGKVTVTGLGQRFPQQGNNGTSNMAPHNIMQIDGNLRKTITSDKYDDVPARPLNNQSTNVPLRKTIQNSSAIPTVTNRVGNNIVIAPSDAPMSYSAPQHQHVAQSHLVTVQQPVQVQQPQYTVNTGYMPTTYQQPQFTQPEFSQYTQPAQPPPQYTVQEPMPMIRIRNDEYRAPEPVHVPVIDPDPLVTPRTYYDRQPEVSSQATRTTVTRVTRPPAPKPVLQDRLGGIAKEEEEVLEDVLSPLQGYKLLITNLHPVVTQDDIVELFGAVGALRKAKLIKVGAGEVVFIRKDDALAAVRKYHNRELDGQPMQVVLTTSGSPMVLKTSSQESVSQPLRLPKSTAASGDTPVDVDIGLLHKALFKTTSKEDPPTRPVAFTVKI